MVFRTTQNSMYMYSLLQPSISRRQNFYFLRNFSDLLICKTKILFFFSVGVTDESVSVETVETSQIVQKDLILVKVITVGLNRSVAGKDETGNEPQTHRALWV